MKGLVKGCATAHSYRHSLLSSERLPQFVFRLVQQPPLLGIQCLACAIDIERQHRHGGSIGAALATRAGFSGTFERERDLSWTALLKDAFFEIQGMAPPRHVP